MNTHEVFGNEYIKVDERVLQFTGFKDVNGQKIYEGQIVYAQKGSETMTGKVVYDDGEPDERIAGWLIEGFSFSFLHMLDRVYVL